MDGNFHHSMKASFAFDHAIHSNPTCLHIGQKIRLKMCYNDKYNSKVNSKGGLKMNLFNLFDVSVREKGKKLTAMVLTLFLAAGFLLAPSADMTRVYAGEDVTASEPSGEEEPGKAFLLRSRGSRQTLRSARGKRRPFLSGRPASGLSISGTTGRRVQARGWYGRVIPRRPHRQQRMPHGIS